MSSTTKRISIIEKLKGEAKELKNMLDDTLANSDEYRELQEQKKHITREFNVVKEQITNEPKTAELKEKLKETNKELSEEKEILSQELAVHFSKVGKSEIEMPDGKIYKFKLSATFSEKNGSYGEN